MPAGLSAYFSRARTAARCRCGPCSTATHSRKTYSTVNTTSENIFDQVEGERIAGA